MSGYIYLGKQSRSEHDDDECKREDANVAHVVLGELGRSEKEGNRDAQCDDRNVALASDRPAVFVHDRGYVVHIVGFYEHQNQPPAEQSAEHAERDGDEDPAPERYHDAVLRK
jgi:hypothetical protein